MSDLTEFWLKGESEKALRIAVDENAPGTWVPKSILNTIHKYPRDAKGRQRVDVELPRWKARQLGLED